MTVDEFLARLDKAKRSGSGSGSGWTARCPGPNHKHGDKSASLSVKEGDDGRVLVKCHAGCDVDAIVGALGLEIKDLFDERLDATRAQRQSESRETASRERRRPESRQSGQSFEARIERTYNYVDENGQLLFQAVRLHDPKDFRQRHRDGEKWVWNLKDVRRVIYRLPDVLVAAGDGRAVFVVEGEKDADALVELGFTATCNPMGAGEGKWLDEYGDAFRGCSYAIVVVDCDEVGRKHGHAVARVLARGKTKVKIIDLSSERDDGYDLSDFLTEHGDGAKKKLERLARTTRRWTAEDAERALSPRPNIVRVSDFVASVPEYDDEKDYLGPFIHGGYRIHVAGPIGHGKTSFLLEAESAALRGDGFLGWQGRGNVRVLHIDLEMPAELLAQAIRDARLDACDGFSLLHLPDGLEVDTNAQHRRMLARACEGFDIVAIDPWYKLLGQELEMSSARAVVGLLDGIRQRHPKMCMLVGFHAQEPNTPKSRLSMASISGFKFFQRPADIVLTFQRTGGDSSRIVWIKNRSPRLDVKHDEVWRLEWKRGEGFTREESRSASDRLIELITDEWQTTSELAKQWKRSRSFTSQTLAKLAENGKVDCREGGGRGNQTRWRLAAEDVPWE